VARPRQFDEKEVLSAAQEVFWSKGYEAASTRDLADSMGLTQASLYNAFGDKRGLYMKALQQYADSRLDKRFALSEEAPSSGLTIVTYFTTIMEDSLADPDYRGCLLVNSALEASADDPGRRAAIAAQIAHIESFLRRHLTIAQESGEIPATQSPEDLAKLLLSVQFGLRALVRVRPERELLNGLLRPVMEMLKLPWSPSDPLRGG
jgi:TetR/AcrR family transcriptional repressor of nem operon